MERQVIRPYNRSLLVAVAAAAVGTLIGYALAIANAEDAEKRASVWRGARCVCAERMEGL